MRWSRSKTSTTFAESLETRVHETSAWSARIRAMLADDGNAVDRQ